MKKILLMLSLIVVGMFLVGCAPELQNDSDVALAGEAFKVPKNNHDVPNIPSKLGSFSCSNFYAGGINKINIGKTPLEICEKVGLKHIQTLSAWSVYEQNSVMHNSGNFTLAQGYRMNSLEFGDPNKPVEPIKTVPEQVTEVNTYYITCCK